LKLGWIGLLCFISLFSGTGSATALCKSPYSTELKELLAAENSDWANTPSTRDVAIAVARRDIKRRQRITEIKHSDGLCTADDFLAAAVIMSHGTFVSENVEALKYASVAQALDPSLVDARSAFARAIDQITVRAQGNQLYGTVMDTVDGKSVPVPNIPGFIPDQR
jgi:hypothetical protein